MWYNGAMTQMPPPPYGYGPPTMQYGLPDRRSNVPMVLGILGIIYGLFGLLLGGLNTALGVGGGVPDDLTTLTIVQGGYGVLVNLLLVVASILLVLYKRLGLTLANVWAVLAMLGVVLGVVVVVAMAEGQIEAAVAANPAAPRQALATGYYGGGICVSLVFVVLPILMLVLLNRPAAKASLS